MRILRNILVLLFVTTAAVGQQINPVPDYIFRNQMSVGRNAPTDTAAYLSVGPRFGAVKGFMPPMVVDTASFSGSKRNGLTIFSVQKNKYVYWDSVGVKWAEMAGTGGSAITGTGAANYVTRFTSPTNIDSTRMFYQNGRFSIGQNTTTNGVFNVYGGLSYFDTTLRVGSQAILIDENSNETLINMQGDSGSYSLQVGGNMFLAQSAVLASTTGSVGFRIKTPASLLHGDLGTGQASYLKFTAGSTTGTSINDGMNFGIFEDGSGRILQSENLPITIFTNNVEVARFFGNGNFGLNTGATDAGFRLQVNGSARVSNDLTIGSTISTAHTFISGGTGGWARGYRFVGSSGTQRGGYWVLGSADDVSYYTIGSAYNVGLTVQHSNSNTGIGTVNDAGYKLDVNGTLRIVNGAVFATTSGNLGLGLTAFGTSANFTFAIQNGTAPSTSPTDAFQMYSADITAGNAAPHIRTENGKIIKLYQETTGVTAAALVGGGGTTLTDTDTFDGYTLAKVVKALRNLGILE